jgi:5'-nucleotidase
MVLLLTNDDGIECEGINALARELRTANEVWVVAPELDRSAISHAMSLRNPVNLKKIGEKRYSCTGMPADCVIISHLGAIPEKFDAVVSGINDGPNLGTDLIYSGTAAAARQAVMLGYPGIAVSLMDGKDSESFALAAKYVARNLETLVSLCDSRFFINLNLPANENEIFETVETDPCIRHYYDTLETYYASEDSIYCTLKYGQIETEKDIGSDWAAVKAGKASLSFISINPASIRNPKFVKGSFR